MKDVPSIIPEGLEIACIPERESPFDVWISNYEHISARPSNSKIGTSSLRRLYQLKRLSEFCFLLHLSTHYV